MRLTLAAAFGRLSFALDRKPDEEHHGAFFFREQPAIAEKGLRS
ncbi:hypothetical protein [Pseudomonas sp. EggHat1]|nr:hypothetical protein [Pseudomonas sp. EggHat1]